MPMTVDLGVPVHNPPAKRSAKDTPNEYSEMVLSHTVSVVSRSAQYGEHRKPQFGASIRHQTYFFASVRQSR